MLHTLNDAHRQAWWYVTGAAETVRTDPPLPVHAFGRRFSGSMNTGSVTRTGTKLAVSGDAA